jgi:hypothetical protein
MHYKHSIFLIVVLFLVVAGAVIWILNVEGQIHGAWSNILGVIFTVLGIVFAMLQWHGQMIFAAVAPVTGEVAKQEVNLEENLQTGVLVIYTKKQLRGTTIHLFHGFDSIGPYADLATNIVERKVNGKAIFIGTFPVLESGNYRILTKSVQNRAARTTVYAGRVTEIDWR